MRFKLHTSSDNQQTFLEIPTTTLVSGTVLVAIISAVASLLTNVLVNIPRDRADIELKMQTHALEVQKFQLELLQKALQGEIPEHRAQSLIMLVDMKLLNAPRSMIVEFTKKPDTVPHWLPESTGRMLTPSTPLEGTSIISE